MKKIFIFAVVASLMTMQACKKEKNEDPQPDTTPTSTEVLIDFAGTLAIPNYTDIRDKASLLNDAIIALNANPNTATLQAAQDAWRAVRVPWEMCEGYLFGPAADYQYDPATDTWPVNTTELDSLLASANPLELSDIEQLQNSLKGYHPIEYVLFGVGGSRTPAELTPRLLKYVVSLGQHLKTATSELRDHWDDFSTELTTAGNGSTRFSTRKDAFLEIVGSMQGICDEVANGKMKDPLDNLDSTAVESQYAHSATIDFRHNIIGIENAYMSRYNGVSGNSLHDLVSAHESSLDIAIQNQITLAYQALLNIDDNYGWAIFNQQNQINTARQAINDLTVKLDELTNHIHSHVTD